MHDRLAGVWRWPVLSLSFLMVAATLSQYIGLRSVGVIDRISVGVLEFASMLAFAGAIWLRLQAAKPGVGGAAGTLTAANGAGTGYAPSPARGGADWQAPVAQAGSPTTPAAGPFGVGAVPPPPWGAAQPSTPPGQGGTSGAGESGRSSWMWTPSSGKGDDAKPGQPGPSGQPGQPGRAPQGGLPSQWPDLGTSWPPQPPPQRGNG